MANRIQLRRDGAQQWANINPILAQGELGIEIDTSRIKIGDGVTPWNSLKYERPLETESNAANTLVKRDADGNFQAGAVTATLIGNASTATRLSNARQIQLAGQITGSGSFDGSSNLTLNTDLSLITTLPHYDPANPSAESTYTRVRVNSQGRVVGAELASTLADYGITDAQALDDDLTSLAQLTNVGILVRASQGNIITRQLTGGGGRIIFTVPDGTSQNPFIDLADTAVVVGSYNTESLTSVTGNASSETVNATKFTVDRYGRLTAALTVPIATATEGSKYAVYDAGTPYNRYDIIENASNVYQAIADIAAAQGAPTHSTETITYAVTVNAEPDGNKYYLDGSIYPNLTFKRGSTYIFNQDDATNVLHPLHFSETSNGTHGGGSVYNVGVTYKLDGVVVSYSDYYDTTNFTNATTRQVEIVVPRNAPKLLHYYCYYHSGMANNAYIDVVHSDSGNWRWLNPVAVEQKGLASFAQEDFDVDGNGHVVIAASSVDNTQLQNNVVGFADGNTVETFELDNELTPTSGYRGFNYLNYVKINDTSGNLLFSANNTGDSGSGEIDINVRSYYSDPDITLDGTVNQTLDKTGDGNLTFQTTQDSTSDRDLNILATNAGSGSSNIKITAEDTVQINASAGSGKIWIEDARLQDNYIATTNSTLNLDPGDDRANTGTVRVWGDLQVDGTTTTVNSTTVTIDDPIFTLGGDTTPVSDDGLDRGIEFKYYDTQARIGFFGWDEDLTRLDSGTGGYAFLYNATNSSETFTGTDAYIKAGALSLTTNTGSTSTTTGTLVVTGGVGISENVHVGGEVTVAGQTEINDTVLIKSDNEDFKIQTGAGVDKFTVDTDTGNTVIEGTLDVQLETTVTDNLIVQADNKKFEVKSANGTSKFDIDTDNGNTHTDGTLDVDGGVTFNSTLDVDNNTTLNAELDVDGNSTFHNNILLDTTGKTLTITNGSTNKFQVTSTNGNTDIEGTLNVAQFVYLEDNDVPTISTDGSNNFVISGGDYGAFRFDGGGYVEGDTLFNSDIYINGAINQKDQGTQTETFSTQNYLRVRYKFRAGTTAALTPSFATDNGSNLRVFGGAGIATDLHIGDDLFIGKLNSGDTVEFSVLGESGNTEIGRTGQGSNSAGTLTVHGDGTFNRNVAINGNTTIGNQNSDTLTVNAVTQFTDNATVDGDLTVNQNALIEGNLTVNGVTTTVNSTTTQLDDPVITLGGDTAPQSSDAKDRGVEFRYFDGTAKIGFFGWDNSASRFALFHAATNSSEAFTGTRSGIDAGSIKLFDTTSATNSSSGALIVGGGAGIGEDLFIGDDLSVGDDASIGGNLAVTGTFDVTNDLAVNNNKFTVNSATGDTQVAGTFGSTGAATLSSTLAVTSNTTIGGTLGVTNATTLSSTLSVTSNTDIGGTLDVDGATNVTNTLGVTGVTSLTNNASATTTGSYTGDGALRVTGGASIGNNLVVAGDVRFYGNSVIDGTVSYASIQTYAEKVRFNNNADAVTASSNVASVFTQGGLAVSKKAFIGNDLDVGGGNFTVDGPTGNTNVSGNFGVIGSSTVSTITASGVADLQSTVTIGGNLAVGNNKFNVNSSNGNTDIDGSLDVLGQTVIDDTLNVTQAVDFDSTLNVDGGTTLNAALVNNSTSLLKDNVILRGASKSLKLQNGNSQDKITLESTTGHVTMAGNLVTSGTGAFTDAVTMGNTLNVTGQITGNLTGDVTGTSTNADNIDVNNTNNNTIFYPMFAAANTGHTGAFVDSANLTYNPFSNTLTVNNFTSTTNFEVQGNMNVTGTITFGQSQVGSIANHNTDALTEGTSNLYFTNERVDDRVNALITGGTGITATYDDAGNILTLSATQSDINTDNVTEGSTNLFTTAARSRTHFTYGTGIELSGSGELSVTQGDINTDNITEGSTNIFYTNARFDTQLATKDTGDLTEGSNLYYTDARADARIAAATTSDLTEGSNLYFTDARADARIAAASTSDLSEGTNLYHTTARARASISAGGDLSYNASTGVMSVTLPTVFSGNYNDLSNLPSLFSGAYNDLTGKPTLGTAAATASTDYATAAQGAKADSALQAETITLAQLKTAAANSATYAAFQAAIAAL